MGPGAEIDPMTSCHRLDKVLITVCHVNLLCTVPGFVM